MSDPTFFKPHALAKAPIIREGRLTGDQSMPERDWVLLDAPAYERLPARSVCAEEFRNERRQAAA